MLGTAGSHGLGDGLAPVSDPRDSPRAVHCPDPAPPTICCGSSPNHAAPCGTERGRDELGVPNAPLVQGGEGRQVSQSDGDRAVAAMQMGSNADGPVL